MKRPLVHPEAVARVTAPGISPKNRGLVPKRLGLGPPAIRPPRALPPAERTEESAGASAGDGAASPPGAARSPQGGAAGAHPLAALEQGFARNRRRIGSALRTFLHAPAPLRKAVSPAAKHPLRLDFDGAAERASSRAAGYDRQIRQLRELQAHPGVLIRRFESSAGPLTAAAPAVATAMQRKARTAVDFLLSKASPQPETWAGDRAQPPSDAELARWGRYVNALQDPLAALEGLARGRVPAEAMEAVRTVYPALYGEMQRQIARALIAHRTGGNALSVPQRHALARFLGAPVDRLTAPDFGQALQRTYARERAQDPQPPRPAPPQAGRGGRKLITYQTPTQRIENR